MKPLVFVVLIIATVVGQEVANGLGPLKSKRSLAGKCEGGKRQECADCATVNICKYDQTVVAQYRCMQVDPTRPNCVDGDCVAGTFDRCSVQIQNDLCPTEAPGYYPDPTNCTNFLYCDNEAHGWPQTCLAASNVYSQSVEGCVLKRRSSDCFQVDCQNSKNKDKWFTYTPFPQIYFYCSQYGPLIFKCPSENDIFDVKTLQCEFQCPSAGRFEYPDAADMYYECVQVTTSKVEKFLQRCPGAAKFDNENKRCSDAI